MTTSPDEIAKLKAEVAEMAARLERIEAEAKAPGVWPPVTEEMVAVGEDIYLSAPPSSTVAQDVWDIYRAMARLAPEPEVSEEEVEAGWLGYVRECGLDARGEGPVKGTIFATLRSAREARIKARGL